MQTVMLFGSILHKGFAAVSKYIHIARYVNIRKSAQILHKDHVCKIMASCYSC